VVCEGRKSAWVEGNNSRHYVDKKEWKTRNLVSTFELREEKGFRNILRSQNWVKGTYGRRAVVGWEGFFEVYVFIYSRTWWGKKANMNWGDFKRGYLPGGEGAEKLKKVGHAPGSNWWARSGTRPGAQDEERKGVQRRWNFGSEIQRGLVMQKHETDTTSNGSGQNKEDARTTESKRFSTEGGNGAQKIDSGGVEEEGS